MNRFGLIAVEDLNVKGLAAGMLAKSVHDAGWSAFLNKLSYKAECAGRELVKVDPRRTSQTCLCGARVSKTLAVRWHDCPACGLSAARGSRQRTNNSLQGREAAFKSQRRGCRLMRSLRFRSPASFLQW